MKLRLLVAFAVFVVAGVATAVRADTAGLAGNGDPFTLFFDENGNGSYCFNNGLTDACTSALVADPGVMTADPNNGGNLALAYALPEPVIAGDVSILEPPPPEGDGTSLSDLLRFADTSGFVNCTPSGGCGVTATNGLMFYYSDNGGPDDGALADVGLPPILFPNGSVNEVGPEGNNGFDWFPGGNVYHGVSDVPEPASLLLLGTGLIGIVSAIRRKRSA